MADSIAAPTFSAKDIAAAASILRGGGVGVFPTDTVYGVGTPATNEAGLHRIYIIKGRPTNKPLQLLLADVGDFETVVDVPPVAHILMERFLPGGLTLVLKRRPIVSDAVTAGGETVAVRVPDQPLLLDLIRAISEPLAATSANLSGRPAPVESSEARVQLGNLVDFILDGGRCAAAQESTIVDLSGPEPRLLRTGAVPIEAIEEALGRQLER